MSTAAIRGSVMPFCGPNVLVAPNMPVSGLSTSVAATSSTSSNRSRAGSRSTCLMPRSAATPAVDPAVAVRAQRREEAGPAVVGAAAAEPDHDLAGAGLDRGDHQLADAVRRRQLGARRPGEVDAARLRALDVRRVVGEQDPPGHRVAERAAHRQRASACRPGSRRGRRRSPARRRTSAPGRARRPAPAAASPRPWQRLASTAVSVPANLSGAMRTRMRAFWPPTYGWARDRPDHPAR